MLLTGLFKTKFQTDENLNVEGNTKYWYWNHAAKAYLQNMSFLNLPNFTFQLPLANNNIFVKTVCAIKNYDKPPPELFQINFSYLIFIKIFAII